MHPHSFLNKPHETTHRSYFIDSITIMPPKTRRSSRMIRCPPGRKSKPNTAKKRKGTTLIPRASASNSDSDESSDSDVDNKEDEDDNDAYDKEDDANDEEDEALSIPKKQDASAVVTKPVK